MDAKLLSEKYADQIDGVLQCYDRILISGNLDPFCYAAGMAGYLRAHEIRLFDYAQFAQPLREAIRQQAETLAQQQGLKIEFVRKKKFRKEDRVQAVLKQRGTAPGLVHIFSAMESCASYQPWYDKATGKTLLKYTESKCLHYYFYFIDKDFGLKPLPPLGAEDWFDIIAERYECGSLIVTSNRALSEWPELFGNPLLASAGLDRLFHNAHALTITGDSFRARTRQLGQPAKSAPQEAPMSQ